MNFREEYLNKFLSTAIERHNIFLKKELKQPEPWTEDTIFKKYFFCNVFRQLDKCSQWIINNVVHFNDWRLLILYRYISTYELFEEIQLNCSIDDIQGILKFLENKHLNGDKIFNGCFYRNTRIDKGKTCKMYESPFYLIKHIEDNGLEKTLLSKPSLQTMVEFLKTLPGVGGFMAYEYACDFEYAKFFNPIDKHTWANNGPGASRGLSYLIFGNKGPKKNSVDIFSQEEWIEGITQIYYVMKGRFGAEEFSMREVEHWLCEFAKYCKYEEYENGGKRVKYRKYEGGINGI